MSDATTKTDWTEADRRYDAELAAAKAAYFQACSLAWDKYRATVEASKIRLREGGER